MAKQTKAEKMAKAASKNGALPKHHYNELVRFGMWCARELGETDQGYMKPAINFIALENMILGYLLGLKWHQELMREMRKMHTREDLGVSKDWCLQAACDAVQMSPMIRHKFSME